MDKVMLVKHQNSHSKHNSIITWHQNTEVCPAVSVDGTDNDGGAVVGRPFSKTLELGSRLSGTQGR